MQCHGAGDSAQLGNNSFNPVSAPGFEITSFEATEIGAGVAHSCALDKTGEVRCWGSNSDRQAGDIGEAQLTPAIMTSNIARYIPGPFHNAALPSSSAELWAWGKNDTFQVAETGLDREVRAKYRTFTSAVVDVANGHDHTCALLDTGVISCWGDGTDGQLGDGGQSTSATPVDVEWI